jgi:hypothetical protein
MAVGTAGSSFCAELNRLANGGTYPAMTAFLDEQGAANKWAGFSFHSTIHAATTAATAGVYAAGTAGADGGTGVGATITAPSNAALVIDGHTMLVGERVLYWKNTDAKTNGIYVVTNAGSGATKWVITRATDADNGTRAAEVSKGDWFKVTDGATYTNQYFRLSVSGTGVNGSIIIGTDNITYEIISAPTFPNGLGIVAALNFKMDPSRTPAQYKDIIGVCNELAGTTNKSAIDALRSIA